MSLRKLILIQHRLLNLNGISLPISVLSRKLTYTNLNDFKGHDLKLVSPKINKRSISTSNVQRDCFNIQDEDDFKTRVLDSKEPVVVDFHAKWCGPCKILAPRLETIIQSNNDKVHLAKVDIDDNSEIAMEYDVSAVPSVLGFKGGKVVDKFIGVIDDDKITAFVGKLVGP